MLANKYRVKLKLIDTPDREFEQTHSFSGAIPARTIPGRKYEPEEFETHQLEVTGGYVFWEDDNRQRLSRLVDELEYLVIEKL